jgi:hypothetical protein
MQSLAMNWQSGDATCETRTAGSNRRIRGEGGAPPYPVRWKDAHESLFTPSSDTFAEQLAVTRPTHQLAHSRMGDATPGR